MHLVTLKKDSDSSLYSDAVEFQSYTQNWARYNASEIKSFEL
jgi:hypothetical protein